MKKFILLLAGFAMPFISIAQKTTDSTFTLKLITKHMSKATKVYLAYQVDGKKIIDSAAQQNGIYLITGKAGKTLNATLVADPDQLGLPRLINKTKMGAAVDLLQLYVYPGSINMKTDSTIAGAQFTGASINADNQRLQQMGLNVIKDQQMAVGVQLRAAKDAAAAQVLIKKSDSLNRLRMPILKKFIAANPNSLIALFSLQDYAGSPPNPVTIEPMFMKLNASVRNTPEGMAYYKFLMDQKNLNPGVMAPGFTQNDTAGKPVSLLSFRGKYVLLDFWASWCGPCRENNPKLVQIYNEFKGRNFTILGISLDAADGRDAWLQAIKDDHLTWTQVTDLRHWDNRVAKLYSVPAIPQSFLIAPNGMIIAKGLDPEQLRKKLQEVLPAK